MFLSACCLLLNIGCIICWRSEASSSSNFCLASGLTKSYCCRSRSRPAGSGGITSSACSRWVRCGPGGGFPPVAWRGGGRVERVLALAALRARGRLLPDGLALGLHDLLELLLDVLQAGAEV